MPWKIALLRYAADNQGGHSPDFLLWLSHDLHLYN